MPAVAAPLGRGAFGGTDRATIGVGVAAFAVAGLYAFLMIAGKADLVLLAPLATVLVCALVVARPIAGIYLLLAAALLFEQYDIPGISPLTAQTRFFQNVSTYLPIPLRLSAADLLVLLTLASAAFRRIARRERPFAGPLAVAAALYLGAFGLGTVIGLLRGGFDGNAALAEVRGPLYLALMYLLAADLVRGRRQILTVVAIFAIVVAVKAVQGIANYSTVAGIDSIEAVTGHEDTVFFNAGIALAIAALLLGRRTPLALFAMASAPVIMLTELLTERRAGLVGLGAVIAAMCVLVFRAHPRRAVVFAAAILVGAALYVPLFWDAEGALGEPTRALRTVLGDPTITARDQLSDHWREIENANIAFTMRQLPLTGVGVGQEYLFHRDPPVPSATFVYWRFITHNALLWLWLKAGPLGALALAFLVARALLVSSRLFGAERDPDMRLALVLPLALVVAQVVFSSVELGLTYSRTMLVDGAALGLVAAVSRSRA